MTFIIIEKSTTEFSVLQNAIAGANRTFKRKINCFQLDEINERVIKVSFHYDYFTPIFVFGNYYCQYLKGSPLIKRSNLYITEKLILGTQVEFLIVGRSKGFVEGVLKKFNDENHTDFYLKKFETGENFVSTIEGKKIAYEDIFYLGIFYWRELENYDRENPITYIDI